MLEKLLIKLKTLEELTGYDIVNNYLGKGLNGVAFTYKNKVVKLTNYKLEAKAARWVQNHYIEHAGLPVIYDVIDYSMGIYGIVREPLSDLDGNCEELNLCLKQFELATKSRQRKLEQNDFKKQLHDIAVTFNFCAKTTSHVTDIVDLLSWLIILKKIIVTDQHHLNYGLRNGTVVIRDLGCFVF